MPGTARRHAARLRRVVPQPVADVVEPKPVQKEIRPLDADRAARFRAAARADQLDAI